MHGLVNRNSSQDMKLITPDSSPRRMWWVLFLGFSGIFALLILILWVAIGRFHSPDLIGACWIATVAALGGAYFANQGVRTMLEERRKHYEGGYTLQGHHPRLGAFNFRPYRNWWSASVELNPGHTILLCGSGLAPSDDEVALWLEIIAPNIQSLIKTAAAALLPPPPPCHDTMGPVVFSDRVELMEGGKFELSFEAPAISDQINLFPRAIFAKDLTSLEAEWLP
jgi:hypothetical protein